MHWVNPTLLRGGVALLGLCYLHNAAAQQAPTVPIAHLKPEVANRIVVAPPI